MKYVRIITSIVLCLVIVLTVPTPSVSALNSADYVGQGIDHYDTRVVCPATSSSNLAGENNKIKIFSWLTSNGFNAAQAAGILGNLQTESRFDPFVVQNGTIDTVLPIDSHREYHKGFGLVQWDGGRRQQILRVIQKADPDFANTIKKYGSGGEKAPDDILNNYLDIELKFVVQELSTNYKSVDFNIKKQPNTVEGAQDAAEEWVRHYEIPGNMAENVKNRRANAVVIFNELKDMAPASATSSTTSSSGTTSCSPATPAGKVMYYSQLDNKWASSPYAGGTLGEYGCGPTAMAMILASLHDKTITPPDVAKVAGVQVGQTDWQKLISGVNAKWNVGIDTKQLTWSQAIDFVKSGKGYVWVGGEGTLPFTKIGHMVAIVGVQSNGDVTIADPANPLSGHDKIKDYPAAQVQAGVKGLFGVPKK